MSRRECRICNMKAQQYPSIGFAHNLIRSVQSKENNTGRSPVSVSVIINTYTRETSWWYPRYMMHRYSYLVISSSTLTMMPVIWLIRWCSLIVTSIYVIQVIAYGSAWADFQLSYLVWSFTLYSTVRSVNWLNDLESIGLQRTSFGCLVVAWSRTATSSRLK